MRRRLTASAVLDNGHSSMKTRSNRCNGNSLVELVAIVATIALVIAFLFPLLRPRRLIIHRTRCQDNLKQIGLSFLLFANDHHDQFPFAEANELGGTIGLVNSPQVFRHFEAMSNELNTPKVLVCPNDPLRVRGTNFCGTFGNTNVSYFVGLDADESKPERLLSGDRNITGGRLSNGFLRVLQTNLAAGWTATIHTNVGNIGLADGSVQQTTPQMLQSQLKLQTFNTIRLAIP